jgi:hypothetical protein
MAVKYRKEPVQPAKYLADSNPSDNKILADVKNWKEDSEGFVSTWETNQDKWHRMRMRIKKTKNFPFPGCANLRMPTIETKIRKLKAALYNVVFGIRPIVQAIPSPGGSWEIARKIEKFLDHMIMDVMKLPAKAIIAIDQALEKGFYALKPHWKIEIITRIEKISLDDLSLEEAYWMFDIDRSPQEILQAIAQRLQVDSSEMVMQDNTKALEEATVKIMEGKDNISIELKDVICNYPDIALCDPERLYVPTTTGVDPQSATYIIHEFFEPVHSLKQNAEHKGWNLGNIADIESKKSTDLNDKQTETTKDEREGIERLQSVGELVRIWECYGYYDINDDGVQEKCVITIAPDFDKLLRKITLPFYSGKFPFVKLY